MAEAFEYRKDNTSPSPPEIEKPMHVRSISPIFDQYEAPTAVPSPISTKYDLSTELNTPKNIKKTKISLLLSQIFKKYV